MAEPAKKPCERCGGAGRIPRVQRRLADGSPDPFDIVGKSHALCEPCGGSGEVLAAPAPAPRKPGYAVDQILLSHAGDLLGDPLLAIAPP